jgi:hypothetical protein
MRARARIIPDKVIASRKALDAASKGCTDSKASKYLRSRQQGGMRAIKKKVPRTKRGFMKLTKSINNAQRKADKKSRITILPREGIICRALEKIRAVRLYTQIRAAAQTRANANLPEANMISPEPVRADRGE